MSAVLVNEQRIKDIDESPYPFVHSHTFSGNALGVAAANATLSVIESKRLCERALEIEGVMKKGMLHIAKTTGAITNIRSIGAICAAEIINPKFIKQTFINNAVKRGVFLRPIENTLYWMPPLTSTDKELRDMTEKTLRALIG